VRGVKIPVCGSSVCEIWWLREILWLNNKPSGWVIVFHIHWNTSVCVKWKYQCVGQVCLQYDDCVKYVWFENKPSGWIMVFPTIGGLQLVGSIKLKGSFAEYSLVYRALLQKWPIILSILLTVATPYVYYDTTTWLFFVLCKLHAHTGTFHSLYTCTHTRTHTHTHVHTLCVCSWNTMTQGCVFHTHYTHTHKHRHTQTHHPTTHPPRINTHLKRKGVKWLYHGIFHILHTHAHTHTRTQLHKYTHTPERKR